MARIKELARIEGGLSPLGSGHGLCAGCGIPMVVRTVLNSIPGPKIVCNATGCLEVASARWPHSAWNVPWIHVAFENAAAVASGIDAASRSLTARGALTEDERPIIVAFGGDGGTYDIGFQALSGALERGHRFLYVCYDNQAYMNTGIQRSGATPRGASTTTTPIGVAAIGKLQERKDLTAIAASHHIPYVAQAAASHWQDLSRKVERAVSKDGASFINCLSACPLGWGLTATDNRLYLDRAVDSNLWPLYEVDEGHYRLTHIPDPPLPVTAFFAGQKRFARLLTD